MPSFKSDLEQEKILSRYLDSIYREKEIVFERIFDLNQQHQGIDVKVFHNSTEYLVDEKAQLHYINSDLPTFTFELSYIKDNILKEGWLFDSAKHTQYYFLITGIYLKEDKTELKTHDDIDKLKITSVNRTKLIKHLAAIGLNQERLMEYDKYLRKTNSYGQNDITELSKYSEGLIYYTKHLVEKPINLQLRLEYLVDIKVGKKFHYAHQI
jgi:hypothetical protein